MYGSSSHLNFRSSHHLFIIYLFIYLFIYLLIKEAIFIGVT